MPHLALVPLTGFRIKEEEMRQLGMQLPGLRQRAAAIAELPALGLLTLAGMTPQRWTRSYHAAPQINEEFLEQIAAESPTLVAVSALTASVDEAYRLGAWFQNRGIRTVIGGLHATACPEEATRFFDAVVVGGGESVWRKVLSDAEEDHLAPQYQAPRGGPVDSPIPQFGLLGTKPSRFTLQTQRGCPLACDFCGASRLLGQFWDKPIEAIQCELNAICEISPKPLIELADDNTFAGERNVDQLLDLMQQSCARWFTESDWRIGERPDLLSRLAESGCMQVLVGIESLVFRYPGLGKKHADLNRIMDAVRAIQEAGIVVNGCFIAGADGETRQSLDQLVQFILEGPLAEVQLTLQTPFPGTGLYRRLRNEGRLLPNCGWSSYTLFDVCFQPDRMSVEELASGFRDSVRQVFLAEAAERRSRLRREIWRQHKRVRA